MATRVYISSHDPAFLERVAGVPAGTHALTLTWRAQFDYQTCDANTEEGMDAWRAWQDAASPEILNMDHLMDEGFGRLMVREDVLRHFGEEYCCGGTGSAVLIQEILAAQARSGRRTTTVSAREIAWAGGLNWG